MLISVWYICVVLLLEDGFMKEFEFCMEKGLDEKINWDIHMLKLSA